MLPGEPILSGAKKDHHVSEFMVCQSGAGYYIGTYYTYCGKCKECKEEPWMTGCSVPNTRETGYYASHEDAEAALEDYQATGALRYVRG